MNENEQIKSEMNPVISELKSLGVDQNSNPETYTGLGDVVENVLKKFGITEERFKKWFNLKECNCTERKKFLNNLFSWKKNGGL